MSRGHAKHLAVVTALTASLVGTVAAPAVATPGAPVAPRSTVSAPSAGKGAMRSTVDGTFTGAGRTGTVHGTFTPTRFSQHDNRVFATGRLAAIMVDLSGKRVGTVTRTVTVPLRRPARTAHPMLSCQVLNLMLGPLEVNQPGQRVHLNAIRLNVTAPPGAGNLLGNLLCAVSGLLNGPGVLNELVDDLNTVLGLLNG